MDDDGFPIRIVAIILFLAAPAGIIYILSHFYDNPYLQPLDLNWKEVAATGEELGFARIDVHINWGQDWSGTTTRAELHDMIAATLEAKTEFYRFEFHDQPGENIDVTFVVGSNSYGPFPPRQMIEGIKPAILALKMVNKPEG